MVRTGAPRAGEFALGHVGLVVGDMDRASAAFRKLGFVVAERSVAVRSDEEEPARPAGLASQCVMLSPGYIGLSGIIADTEDTACMTPALARYEGIHVIGFEHADVGSLATAAPFMAGPAPPRRFSRMVTTAAGTAEALFSVSPLPGDMPEANFVALQHHTRDLLWQERLLAHPNGACGLAGIIVCSAAPGEFVRRLAAMIAVREGGAANGIAALQVGAAVVEAVKPAEFARRYAFTRPPAVPSVAGVVVSVADLAEVRVLLRRAGITVHGSTERTWVAPGDACGAIVEFVEAGRWP